MQNKAHWNSGFHSDTAAADPAVGLDRSHHGAQLAQPGAFGDFVTFWRGFIAGAINQSHSLTNSNQSLHL